MSVFVVRDEFGDYVGLAMADTPEAAIRVFATAHHGPLSAAPETEVRARLEHLVQESGLSHREFARGVLGRDARSLRRYLAGETIPPELQRQILSMTVSAGPNHLRIAVAREGRQVGDSVDFAGFIGIRLSPTPSIESPLHKARFRETLLRELSNEGLAASWSVEYDEPQSIGAGEGAGFSLTSLYAFREVAKRAGGPDTLERVSDVQVVEKLTGIVHQCLKRALSSREWLAE